MDVKFYHLTHTTPETAMPRLLEKIHAKGMRSVMYFENDTDIAPWDKALWTFGRRSFLPHGTDKDPSPELQPHFLTCSTDMPNNPTLLITATPCTPPHVDQFQHYLHMFDGTNDASLQHARKLWSSFKDNHQLTYWKQEKTGEWTNKTGG